jgi:hypothetical protein
MTSNRTGAVFLGAIISALFVMPVQADKVTECTDESFCYCVESDLSNAVATRVEEIRTLVRAQRNQGKAVGYVSIPLSSLEGSVFGVNVKVAAEVKELVEERFGPRFAWMLNPGASAFELPKGATGADYMLMWTRVLQGQDGLGADIDFFYFVGPSDFARHFGLNAKGDMEKLDAYYDGLAKTDPALSTTVDKVKFRNYYALRASAAFSYGAHDEWNIARSINEKRRGKNAKSGIGQQLGIFFDGRGVAPALFDSAVSAGSSGVCPQ